MPATPDVIVSITRYTVSVLPADDINHKYFALHVELKPRGWIVTDGHEYYGPDGGREYSQSTAHHFADYDDALDLAKGMAPHLSLNGDTATEAYHRTHPAPTPMTVYLSTECADPACEHTLNWHSTEDGCILPSCACRQFRPAAPPAIVTATGTEAPALGTETRTSYRLEHRQPGTHAWNHGTPGIGARWSYESRAKAEQRLAEARDRWPAYEHRKVTRTTTVTETVEPEPAGA
ncbi:hypothetical protein ACFVJK_46845 [Streptomyces sp. NPDC127172]|uniref:hypothetical protein n=1 Tax=Streptomyces sp. NPDC127172 TaxID=3345382 RepID=UPI00362CE529